MKRLQVRSIAAAFGTFSLLVLLPGCGGAPPAWAERESVAEAPSAEAPGALAADFAPAPVREGEAPDSLTFSERVVVFLEGTAEEIEAMRGELDEEDFHVVADDAMYYRATAHEFLERLGLPVKTFRGRRPLYFVVSGEVRRIDLAEASTIDVIVLYDTDRKPCIVAPIDVHLAGDYFSGASSGSEWQGCR